jgi:hypothetical protein
MRGRLCDYPRLEKAPAAQRCRPAGGTEDCYPLTKQPHPVRRSRNPRQDRQPCESLPSPHPRQSLNRPSLLPGRVIPYSISTSSRTGAAGQASTTSPPRARCPPCKPACRGPTFVSSRACSGKYMSILLSGLEMLFARGALPQPPSPEGEPPAGIWRAFIARASDSLAARNSSMPGSTTQPLCRQELNSVCNSLRSRTTRTSRS